MVFCASAWLCWIAVSWALQPGQYLVLDESGNLIRFLTGIDWSQVTLLPQAPYNDRPVGFVLERWLYDLYGFDYPPQLRWFLLLHAANLVLGYALFRKLGVSRSLALASIGVFGVLSTTAQTATYLGAAFDVGALFFSLAATLLVLRVEWWATAASVILYALAVRTKEFAIVLPALWVILAAVRVPEWSKCWKFRAQRLSGPFAVMAIFGVKYALLVARMMGSVDASNPYRMRMELPVIWASLVYYVKLIFAAEDQAGGAALVAIALGAVSGIAVLLRNGRALFAMAAFVLMLLPVTMLPAIRTPFYVYAPQLFLLLAVAVILDDCLARVPKADLVRALCAAAMLWWGWSLRDSSYYKDRVNFMANMRLDAAKGAPDGYKLVPEIGPGSKVFVSSNGVNPWFLAGGPCVFFQLRRQTHDIRCTLNQPLQADSDLIAQGYTMVLDYDAQHHMTVRRLASGGAGSEPASNADQNPGSRR